MKTTTRMKILFIPALLIGLSGCSLMAPPISSSNHSESPKAADATEDSSPAVREDTLEDTDPLDEVEACEVALDIYQRHLPIKYMPDTYESDVVEMEELTEELSALVKNTQDEELATSLGYTNSMMIMFNFTAVGYEPWLGQPAPNDKAEAILQSVHFYQAATSDAWDYIGTVCTPLLDEAGLLPEPSEDSSSAAYVR